VSAAADTLQPGQRRVTLADALAEIAAFERENKLAEASDLANRVLNAAPEHPHVLHMAGIVSYRQGRFDEAISRMEKSVRLAPDIALYPRNMCEIYRSTGRLDAALTSGRRAVELSPADSRAHFNLALIHYERLELDAAVSVAEKALELDPDFAEAHFEKAEALLLSGQLAAGWESYEWRFKLKQAEGMLPKTDKPQWNGEALAPGRLLIIADQGLGDCIQFSRLIPWVTQRAPTPILACSHDLVPILRQLPGLSKIVTSWDQTGAYDCYIPLSGLPRLAGITTENIPNSGAYLNVDPQQTAAWRDKLERLAAPGKRRIALVWAGRPSHKNDRKRTLKLSQFAPLFSIPGITLITVQKGGQIEQAGGYYGAAPLLNLGPEIHDFTDTMAILKNVEHLVTIDTSVAHIAGATGIPTSLVIPYAPDWRWLLNRSDTPWYQSIKLYRQQKPYDWSGVIEKVAEDLRM
jgi:tetratricopeptide (TPR) repeat protein